ncbi:immunity 49 family protein [Streptomyces sp. NPDC002044]|uniref:immunity 49 family protein n=1 Tax=Streptomyces sp. NPDC002044 TaxID=3154662 RepID=UPI00331BE149
MQVHSAVFAAPAPGLETVTCKIRQDERRLATTGPQNHLRADTWLDDFYLAIICRENDRLNQLAQVPVEFLRASGAGFDAISGRHESSRSSALVSVIARHSFPTGHAEEGIAVLQEDAEELIEGLEERPTRLGDAVHTTLTLAKGHCLLDPRAAVFPTWDAWVTAMQVSSAVFATAGSAGETVRCRIAHKERTLTATGPQWYVTADTWLTAFYLALVCRERDRITALCRVPLPLLRGNGSAGEHVHAWIDTLRTYWTGGPNLGRRLVAAVDGTDPEAARDPGTAGRLSYPPMEMFHRIIRDDRPGFNKALANALRWHKEHWSEESRALEATGLVALAPLAIACIAHDAGFPVEVESDYLPAVLLGRDWLGEFPT